MIAAMAMAGVSCAPMKTVDDENTVHFVCIFACLVSVPDAKSAASATVIKASSIGVLFTDAPGPKASIGYYSGIVSSIAEGQDLYLEVSDRLRGSVVIRSSTGDTVNARFVRTYSEGVKDSDD